LTDLLIIGYDGADFHKVAQHSKLVPKLIADGAILTRMHSVYKKTVPSWQSLYTGKPAEEQKFQGRWQHWLDSPWLDENYFWDIFNSWNVSTGLFSLPLTYPPKKVLGWMVSGFPTPLYDKIGLVWPKELESLLDRYVSDIIELVQEALGRVRATFISAPEQLKLAEMGIELSLKQVIDGKLRSLTKLVNGYPTDVVAVGFMFIDHLGHLLPHTDTEFLTQKLAYKYFDLTLDYLLSLVRPKKLIVFSDHGFEKGGHTRNGILLTKNVKLPDQELITEVDVNKVILGAV